jgi:MFS transporter, FSR family, fosmidomycin resistance protein
MSQIAAESSPTAPAVADQKDRFQFLRILSIAGGHFIHDSFTAFVSPLLPLLSDRLGLTLTQAGSLTVFMQIPSLLNVFIGYLADRVSVRYFVILAPAATATLISLMGAASSYWILAILLFITGISVAAFHAPAPAMISQIAGKRVGLGMSLFMAGGELGRTVGPFLVAWLGAEWVFDGMFRLAFLGWVASAILFWRLRNIKADTSGQQRPSLRASLPQFRRLFIPLTGVVVMRNFVITSLSIYLVLMLESEGHSIEEASLTLALWELGGVGGALAGGTLSDRLGRKRTMAAASGISAILMLIFLQLNSWLMFPVLFLLGFTSLSVTPVIQAMVLEQIPEHRATANGLFMLLSFVIRAFITLIIGFMGDTIGLRPAFIICGVLALMAVPFIFALPSAPPKSDPA